MSFLSLRSFRPQLITVEDLSDDLIISIFEACDPVSVTRCSLVCRRWRSIIQDEEAEEVSPIRRAPFTARIFIVDRRRAILEKVSSFRKLVSSSTKCQRTFSKLSSSLRTHSPVTESVAEDLVPSPVYLADQYADNRKPSWAFTFDFSQWAKQYEVVEVCLQNFCSFLERDHGNMDLDSVRSRTNGHPQGNSFHNSMLTPPWSGGCRSPPVDTGTTGSPPEYGTAYHRLPSSQILNNSQQMTSFDEESQSELLRLSAGRLERLAACLEPIRPLHIVFRDHSCYQHRPALLLFWFLQLVRPSLRRITLDGIQSDTRITLHKVMSMQGIEELTIKQPATRPALCVVHNLFLDWLALPAEKRRKVRIRLTGCKDLTARGLASFLNTWRSTVDACLFDSISIDLRSIRVNDFISEVERPIKECEESEWRPPTPPAPYGHGPLRTDNDVTDKKITIKHKKGTAIITTDIVEGYLVLSCSSMQPIRSAPSMPLVGFGRLPRTLSANSFDYRSPTRTSDSVHRLISHSALSRLDGSDVRLYHSPSMLDKMFSFLLRSNA